MTPFRKKIIWQYWQNPFGEDDTEEYVDEKEFDYNEKGNDSGFELLEMKEVKIRPVVSTPMGFIPVQPFQSFSKAFNFWMGHTNFNITQEVKDQIENTPGVEILDIITRYCFRIAVGKAFDAKDVKLSIQETLNANPPKKDENNPNNIKLDENTAQRVSLLQSQLKDKFSYWALLVLPNGEIDVLGYNDLDKYKKMLELYQDAQNKAGGVIYRYD